LRTGDIVWTSTTAHADIDPLSQYFYANAWAPNITYSPRPRGKFSDVDL